MEKPVRGFHRFILPLKDIWDMTLLFTLILAIFIVPVLPPEWHQKLMRFLFTIIYFTALLALEKKQKWIIVVTFIALILEWTAGVYDIWLLEVISKATNVFFFLLVIIRLIIQIAASKQVSLRVIAGSIIGYLLLGLIASVFISFIIQQDPGAFNIPNAENHHSGIHLSESIYYSFVSMATLGYGDIVPLKPYTKSIAVFITVTGQLYIATIIALLVGKFSAAKSGN